MTLHCPTERDSLRIIGLFAPSLYGSVPGTQFLLLCASVICLHLEYTLQPPGHIYFGRAFSKLLSTLLCEDDHSTRGQPPWLATFIGL